MRRLPAAAVRCALALAVGGCSLVRGYAEPVHEDCRNGRDDDLDGQIDCEDVGCRTLAFCHETGRECFDGEDGDHDGPVDCADRDCDDACGEGPAPTCVDGADNDRDGLADHRDPGCWWGARVEARRCASITGEDLALGTEAGSDWVFAEIDEIPQRIEVEGVPALVAQQGEIASASATRAVPGALPGTTLDVELVIDEAATLPSVEIQIASPARRAVGIVARVLSGEPRVLLLQDIEGTTLLSGAVGSRGGWRRMSMHAEVRPGATGLELAVSMPDLGTREAFVPLPDWREDDPIELRWVARDGAGVASAAIGSHRSLERCGAAVPVPELADLRVLSAAWGPGASASGADEICISTDAGLFRGIVDGPPGTLPVLAPAGEHPRPGEEIRALGWDPADRAYRAVAQRVAGTSVGPPVLIASSSCGGPWVEIGAAGDAEALALFEVLALVLDGEAGDRLVAVGAVSRDMVTLVGDASVAGSFAVDRFGTLDGELGVAAAAVGSDLITLRPERGSIAINAGIDTRACGLGDPQCDSVLAPSGELGTFDRFGAPSSSSGIGRTAALAMAPPPDDPEAAWSGALVYQGCDADPCRAGEDTALGITWLDVSPP